jgi:hypothetical protein
VTPAHYDERGLAELVMMIAVTDLLPDQRHHPGLPGPHRRTPHTAETRKETGMSVVRIHHYTVDPADLKELLARRATLITAARAAHPGLAEARPTRLEDGTYTDAWRWGTAGQMQAAFPAATLPGARAAMSLTRDYTTQNGEIIDER